MTAAIIASVSGGLVSVGFAIWAIVERGKRSRLSEELFNARVMVAEHRTALANMDKAREAHENAATAASDAITLLRKRLHHTRVLLQATDNPSSAVRYLDSVLDASPGGER